MFNTTCLIGPEGILYKYRKVNPWLPFEVHASPHDLDGYDEPLFPVADTPIGRIGCAICYDWLFPEAIRQLAANGAEVLVRVSAYMDPWGATEPMNWWTIVNRCRALENTAFVVAANQGASLRHYPPYSWPGGSQVVDFDGRLLAEASPGPGERIVVAPIDITSLRHERATRRGHTMLAHLRTEAYPVYLGASISAARIQQSDQTFVIQFFGIRFRTLHCTCRKANPFLSRPVGVYIPSYRVIRVRSPGGVRTLCRRRQLEEDL